MSVIGIVCEYNPLHKGHAYQLRAAKETVGADSPVVCVMSGNFVQRGECAVYPKHLRAAAAVECGADLVLELPVPWALSSAERFAFGAVSILSRLGFVTDLAFGSESGDLSFLQEIAQKLVLPETNAAIRKTLKEGLSFAAARETVLGVELKNPNDILAVEYLKALHTLGSEIRPLAIRRAGCGHDCTEVGLYPSASALRQQLREGKPIRNFVPDEAVKLYETLPCVFPENLEDAILSRLRLLSRGDWETLPDCTEGLSERFFRAAGEAGSLEELLSTVKTKRYALSRLRRILCCAAIGIEKKFTEQEPPYARVLACSEAGRHLLRETGNLPILTKPAAVKKMGEYANAVFSAECRATDLFVLGYSEASLRKGGQEWKKSPVLNNK